MTIRGAENSGSELASRPLHPLVRHSESTFKSIKMVGLGDFTSVSPFNLNDDVSYNVDNTTPELLKFQLQELYRSKLKDLEHNIPSLNIIHSHVLQSAFNDHLQNSVELGEVRILSSPLPSLSSTPGTERMTELPMSSIELDPNFLNLKILIENSVFDTSKVNKDTILSLPALKQLKRDLQESQEFKEFLSSKYGVSQQFLSTLLASSDSPESDLDRNLLLRLLRLTNELAGQLIETSERVEVMKTMITNHNLACLVLGYVEDVRLSSLKRSTPSARGLVTPTTSNNNSLGPYGSSELLENFTHSFEKLFAHIASVAAQRGVSLPPPPSPSNNNAQDIESRTSWTTTCIDAIITSPVPSSNENGSSDTSYANDSMLPNGADSYQPSNTPRRIILSTQLPNDSKDLAEYQTALNDLRFAHQYLTKEYEFSKENFSMAMQDNRKKITMLENELKKSRELKDLPLRLGEPKTKDSEIARLKKEINFLKIDRLGLKAGNSPKRGDNLSPVSSFNTLGSTENLTIGMGTDLEESLASLPLNSAFAARPAQMSNATSTSILRKEFKKIISDIQDQHDLELSEERKKSDRLLSELSSLRSTSA